MALKVLEKAGYGVRHLPNQGLGNGLRITMVNGEIWKNRDDPEISWSKARED